MMTVFSPSLIISPKCVTGSLPLGQLALVALLSDLEVDVATPETVPVPGLLDVIPLHQSNSICFKLWLCQPAGLSLQGTVALGTAREVEVSTSRAIPIPRPCLSARDTTR